MSEPTPEQIKLVEHLRESMLRNGYPAEAEALRALLRERDELREEAGQADKWRDRYTAVSVAMGDREPAAGWKSTHDLPGRVKVQREALAEAQREIERLLAERPFPPDWIAVSCADFDKHTARAEAAEAKVAELERELAGAWGAAAIPVRGLGVALDEVVSGLRRDREEARAQLAAEQSAHEQTRRDRDATIEARVSAERAVYTGKLRALDRLVKEQQQDWGACQAREVKLRGALELISQVCPSNVDPCVGEPTCACPGCLARAALSPAPPAAPVIRGADFAAPGVESFSARFFATAAPEPESIESNGTRHCKHGNTYYHPGTVYECPACVRERREPAPEPPAAEPES